MDDWALGLRDATDSIGLGWKATLAPAWHFNLTGEFSRTYGNAGFLGDAGGAP